MRVALLQLAIKASGRSANLTRVLRGFVAAVEAVPAPDLVVLPGCCDGLRARGVTPAMVQSFTESIAAAAREWGVYVAAGSLRAGSDAQLVDAARLFDPDGDVVALCKASDGESTCPVCATSLERRSHTPETRNAAPGAGVASNKKASARSAADLPIPHRSFIIILSILPELFTLHE